MGLFGKLGGGRDITLSPQGGLLLAAITMVAIDGDVDDDELAIIRRLDGSGQTADWEDAVKAWKIKSIDECVELAASSLNQKQRLIAIANLIDIAMADGVLAGAEEKLLETYVATFGVPTDEIEKIVDVISTKNDKQPFQ